MLKEKKRFHNFGTQPHFKKEIIFVPYKGKDESQISYQQKTNNLRDFFCFHLNLYLLIHTSYFMQIKKNSRLKPYFAF